MSVRIETVEQLKNPKLVEQVLDRLRRTTKPRNFAFKKRCKLLDDKPVLITAPPGRKLKSSLLRELRLGSPTLKGVVHREKQQLIFTFSRSVNKSDTAKWIAKCMHDAKSPVPLKCVIIRTPKDLDTPTDRLNQKEKERTTEDEIPLENNANTSTEDVLSLPEATDENNDEEVLSPTTLNESPSLEALIATHTSSKKIRWIEDAEKQVKLLEQQQSTEIDKVETLEEQISETQEQILQLEVQIQNLPPLDESLVNPWKELLEAIQASGMTLDEFRNILDQSELPITNLLQILQFLSDDEEMIAYTEIRTHCQAKATEWEDQRSPKMALEHRASSLQETLLSLEAQYVEVSETLTSLEEQQQQLLVKLATRKLSIFDKVAIHMDEPTLVAELDQRRALCTAILNEDSSR